MRLSIIQNYLKTHKIRNTKIIHAFKQFEISQINTIIDEKRERERERERKKANALIIGIQGSRRFEFTFIEDKWHMVIIRSI
jgi:phenylalanyl-tRNA synthetase beta subunit